MRLDRYLSSVSDLSRKQARGYIRAGSVRVDGELRTDPASAVASGSPVSIEGRLLRQPDHRYFMLHKPAGFVCATRDAHRPTALDLLDAEDNPERLQIAGRLDLDTTGLVLITDDGQWNHRVTSPRRTCPKTYELSTAEAIDPLTVTRFARGIVLQPENRRTRPAQLTLLTPHSARLVLTEGRYHQVKRMLGATGNRVTRLHRSAIGALRLDADLPEGAYRPLSREEIDSF